jgi:CRISPR-associated protein Csb2
MFAIEVTLLTGRYVATAYNTRSESEWPPHPARLFSALVATHFAADDEAVLHRAAERAVLEWLECQGAPSIIAAAATARDVVTVFVPVNDVALTNVDDEARRVDEARGTLIASEASGDTKASKKLAGDVRKAEASLKKAIASATEVPLRPMAPRYGQRLLPEYRGRQPRTFPSMTPEDPRVTYVWPDASPNGAQRASLEGLLHRVVRIGHSSSLASLRLADEPGAPTWRPADEGEAIFRVVGSGQLAALERAFARHREIEPRVMPAVPQAYTRRTQIESESVAESVFSDDWLVLRRVEGPAFPMTATAGLARAVRKVLMSYAVEPIPEVLSGHSVDGRPSQAPHLAVVPLPFIGHQHASGNVLGIALVLPRSVSDSDRRAVYTAISRWENTFRREDEETPSVKLNLGAAGELYLERVDWGSVQASLRSATWCRQSNVWYSATPVALDRNTGDLRARDPRKLAEATKEAVEVIARACERIDLPRPKYVEILPAAPWAGAPKARHYPPYPGHAGRTQRVLMHVRIEFERPVKGPILLGAGRFVGVGLFRPWVAQ